LLKWIAKLVGESSDREIKRLSALAAQINALEPQVERLSAEELKGKTTEFRQRIQGGESLDDLLVEAFACVREASRRTIGLRHFDVQLMGGVVLHEGKIAEMRTGEGKTLVATLPLYLNALAGRGAHLVTVNDYLARRDAQWMGPIYHYLGLSVGVIQHESAFLYDPSYQSGDVRLVNLRPVTRREAYEADITYGTNNEFGFDYLRDNMVLDLAQCVQRELFYAIVDEVDNILIDEARTPLIISGQAEESTDKYYLFARLVPRLQRDVDFTIDEKVRSVMMTEAGIAKVEKALGVSNLYDPSNYELTHYLEQALKAQFIFKRDRDYVLVKNGQVITYNDREAEVVIVDEFTGRLMFGRRFSEGLHQAIEAKENVRIRRESQTLATITFQNYFRKYQKLAGMTGTAATERDEFLKIYNLDVVTIPTHLPMIREDLPDLVYKTEAGKFRAVVSEVEAAHRIGRPVLVGTASIEKSEHLSKMLSRRGIEHQVLNAKYHESEAAIIAQAGRPGAVTIATNMAGRGVDILLGGNPAGLTDERLRRQGLTVLTATEEQIAAVRAEVEEMCRRDREKVLAVGGLYIIGTERHESRRIDNQLRGRAGRQGDPGSSRFYVSLEDELMKRFGGPNIAGIMDRLGLEEDVPIEHPMVSKAIESAQTKVEGYNFDLRKHRVEYDDVMNKHREVIYAERRKVLSNDDLRPVIWKMVEQEIESIVDSHAVGDLPEEWDLEGLLIALNNLFPIPEDFTAEKLATMNRQEVLEAAKEAADRIYEEREQTFGPALMRQLERLVMLQIIDRLWVEHLTAMEELQTGIGLRAYGQKDPLVEYKSEAYNLFQGLLEAIQHDIVHAIYRVRVQKVPAATAVSRRITTNRENGGDGHQAAPLTRQRKVGRNDPCPCGSGKKYKKCHGK